jgi:uncharacterized protein (UPF0333 family)
MLIHSIHFGKKGQVAKQAFHLGVPAVVIVLSFMFFIYPAASRERAFC